MNATENNIKNWLQRIALKVTAPTITPADMHKALRDAGGAGVFAAAVDDGIKVWVTGRTGLEIVAFFDLWECEDRDAVWPHLSWMMM